MSSSLDDTGGNRGIASVARALACRGKGILACDESVGLVASGLENSSETRRAWREVLLTGAKGEFLSGAILFDETLRQTTGSGVPFPVLLKENGVIPGVKVDLGLEPVDDSPGETWTKGIEGLGDRCREYYALGARFTKWRSALRIDTGLGLPSAPVVQENAQTLAVYAKIVQKAGLVPIVEPEILIDGVHDMHVSASVASVVISTCFKALKENGVDLRAVLLKPMMIMPGLKHPTKETLAPGEVARATLDCMLSCVPSEVPGIMFLSGGMSEMQATTYLNALNQLADAENAPWILSFSYGRALQTSVMKTWQGDMANASKASEMATALVRANASAQLGKFDGSHPSVMDDLSLYEGFRGHRSGEDPVGV